MVSVLRFERQADMRQIIDATALDSWFVSTRRDAQEMLPHLVRRLVTESVPLKTITRIRFAVHDQIDFPGYDGTIETTAEHPFVPQGNSVWEMGTGGPEEKFSADYGKRTESPGQTDPEMTTFLFVSPHPMRDKQTKEAEFRAQGKWRDVRVLDGVDLAAWLEISPVTARWLAREMGLPVEGLLGLEEYVRQELDARYGRAITPDLVIGGRTDSQEALTAWIESDSRDVRVEGESIEESCAFVAATVLALPAEKRSHVDARLIFASDPTVLDLFAPLQTTHLLVAMAPEVRRRAEAMDSPSVRILVPRMRMAGASHDPSERTTIKLGTIHRNKCAESLRTLGYTNQRSDRISRESKGSLTAVLWMIAQEHDTPLSWANAEGARELLPLLLAGQWETENGQDRALVASMAGKSCEEVEEALARWRTPNGPLILRGTVWDWLAWDYAWLCLCPFMSHVNITAFSAAVEQVLGEPDPKLELAADDRWTAAMHGKIHPYSKALRRGLVGSIALFGTKSTTMRAGKGSATAGCLVRKLLDGTTFDRTKTWLSLAPWLPDLAEAAPDEFLQALDRLQEDKGCVAAFFEEGGMFRSSPHVHLLWALERLAWSEDLLSRAVAALGSLAALDPGGDLTNRPLNSLTEILLPWHPHTTAGPAGRVAAVDILHRHQPEIAWQVAATLLPGVTSFSTGTAEPKWRPWHPDTDESVPGAEYWHFVQEIVTRMLRWASAANHWQTLIESYNNLRTAHPALAAEVLSALHALQAKDFDEKDAGLICDTLRSLLSTHREVADAKWAMTDEMLVPFEDLYERFRPQDLVLQFKWLFTAWPHLPRMRNVSYEEQTKLIEAERLKAAAEIVEQGGIEAAVSMFEELERPDTLGSSLAELGLGHDSEVQLLQDALHREPLSDGFPAALQAGLGYVGRRYSRDGDKWLDAILECSEIGWDSNAYANLALGLPQEGPTWDKLVKWDAEAELLYWQRTPVLYLREAERDAEKAVARLLEVGRPYRAIEVAGMAVGRPHGNTDELSTLPVSRELIVRALQEAPRKDPREERFAPQMTTVIHRVESLLDVLAGLGEELKVLAGIEWAWLAGLDHGRRGLRALERALVAEPDLFVDVLKLVFKAEGEEAPELSDADRGRATQAYHLLEAWHRVPGMSEPEPVNKSFEGDIVFHKATVDEAVLTEWMTRARELARECGRGPVCDLRIGHMLAYSPMGEDKAWPCEPVRNLIDHIRSEHLCHGIETGVYNKRGVHTRMRGGVQELKLAEKFRGYYRKVHAEWPHTGAVLARLAEHFEQEAKWHQEQEAFQEFE